MSLHDLSRRCAVLMTLSVGACVAPSSGPTPASAEVRVWATAVEHLRQDAGWDVRVDPRWMDSVPVHYDPILHGDGAFSPDLVEDDPRLDSRRELLRRMGATEERMEAYVACTPYMGGVPVDSEAALSDRRRACAARARYAALVLSKPELLAEEQGWRIRAYFLTPSDRVITDLVVARQGGEWRVVRETEVFSIHS